jgi:arylsulfatase A-like enzyme/uncharacterized membrane protein YbhN (UPF0104 family)
MAILLEIFIVAILALATVRRASEPWRGRLLNVFKAWVTIRAFWLLLTHPVQMEDGSYVIAWELILDQLALIDATTFWAFCLAAAGIKFVGILASMYRWTLLLRGQGITLPFRHIFGSFLIGRFIGTFLPSTAGLDGYTLYDAARFSGKTVEATGAKALEKVIGVFGIFLSFLVALPFGIKIFGENGPLIAGITVPLALGLIGALLLVLWFPGFVEWFLEHLPLPGKARLQGIVMRIAHSASAYKDKKALVTFALFLSFIVHFTTAAMYYFTAVAISAKGAEFWPIAFGSSIQIFATVVSPFTIAGEGIREAAQYVLLGNMIGPAAAIVSAALGFWAAEALTLLGGIFWWIRPAGYRPDYCLVDGVQVDYDEAARAALALESEEDRVRREASGEIDLPPLMARARMGAGLGLGTGILAGLLIGVTETAVIAAGGFGTDAQVLWYGPLAYASLLGVLGMLGGGVLGLLPMDESDVRGWVPSLGLIGLLIPLGLAITVFRLRRDVFAEQMPPAPVLLGVLGAAGVVALLLFFLGPRLFRSRLGRIVQPALALGMLAVVTLGGAVLSRVAGPTGAAAATPPAVPSALSDRPNLLLVMVDTLRADHLSCYGSDVDTPNLCSLADGAGSRLQAFSHSSWTKPATATLLTSLVPSSHGAMSKPAVLPEAVDTVAEVLAERGYTTGGIVSNINLAESFGFAQGFDEYHYLGPDYLFGASESSSKLILYQIGRSVLFKFRKGLRFGDFYQDSEVVNEVAFDWLERHRDSRFFLFLHYMDPHDPYFTHPYDGYGIARVSNQNPDPEHAAEMQELYKGEIRYLDQNFGRLLERLRELGLEDDTLIVLTSDHGEEFQEHGGWWHGMTLYDEQVHVPLLVRWPQGWQGPAETEQLVRGIDVAPTLIRAAGASPPQSMQGIGLREAGARSEKDRMAFLEEDHEGNVLRGVRTAEWKLIEANPDNPRGLAAVELYELEGDPGESENLAEERAAILSELAAHTEAQEQLARSQAAGDGEAASLSAAQEDALRALGYVE